MSWPLSVVLVANTNRRLAIPALAGLIVNIRRIDFMFASLIAYFAVSHRRRHVNLYFIHYMISSSFTYLYFRKEHFTIIYYAPAP